MSIRDYMALSAARLPLSVRSFPYSLSCLLVERAIRQQGLKVWVRNSFHLGYFTFGISDIDFTFLLDDTFELGKLTRILRRYNVLKRFIPLLGEINVYKNGDAQLFKRCSNFFELDRDPLLCSYLCNEEGDGISVVDQIVFVARMIDSDYHNLRKRFALRKSKWKYHAKKILGFDWDERNYEVDCFSGLLDFFDRHLFHKMPILKIKDFLQFFLPNKHRLFFVYQRPKFRLEFMVLFPNYWSGCSVDSGNLMSDFERVMRIKRIYKEVMLRQIDWEIWGISAQYLLTGKDNPFSRHLKNLSMVLAEMKKFNFPGAVSSFDSLHELEKRAVEAGLLRH